MRKKPKKNNEQKIKKVTGEIFDIWQNKDAEISTDLLGSYTGNPDASHDLEPEQDADDL